MTPHNVAIPAGYTARPVTLDDAQASADLLNAYNIALTGRPCVTPGEIRSYWQQPTMTLATNTLAVFAPDGAGMAGEAELWDSDPHVTHFVFGEVHPAHQGRGIGAALAAWAEARGRELLPLAAEDARVILQQFIMSTDEAADRLLRDRGYSLVRHNLRMSIDFAGRPPQSSLPEGLAIRPFHRGQEEAALLRAVRDEFRDHWGYVEQPWDEDYAGWLHYMDTDPNFDPSMAFVAVNGDEIAGTALCSPSWVEDPDAGWIHSLGVRRPWRRRGVALALLHQCFAALYDRGKLRAKLGVDAREPHRRDAAVREGGHAHGAPVRLLREGAARGHESEHPGGGVKATGARRCDPADRRSA